MNVKMCVWAGSAIVVVALAGCGSVVHDGTNDPDPVHVTRTQPACPEGSAYPPGTAGVADYTDSIQHDSVDYEYLPAVHVTIAQLGSVVTRIQCSMSTYPDTHAPPSHWANDTATGLPARTPVYAVKGFSPHCRLAANVDGHLRTYVAMKPAKHGPVPLACAKIAAQ